MRIDELINGLRAPMYTYTLAKNDKRKGADTRALTAEQKIDTLVKQYVRDNGMLTQDEKDFSAFLGTAEEG